ncbi:hypothetical protein [Allocoleopsis franciscana]|uniref:hypothetical protein n=1 Tax=Allocoleopsis franciscana TaxID=2886352 RepID=UPI0005A2C249|nr:hypothetical protein [Allocoleopsis franciscana]
MFAVNSIQNLAFDTWIKASWQEFIADYSRFETLVKVKLCVSLRESGLQYEGSRRIIQDFELEVGGAVSG